MQESSQAPLNDDYKAPMVRRRHCWWTKHQNKMATANISSVNSVTFSEYYSSLAGPTKERYREKVNLCGFDPYLLKPSQCSDDLADFTCVEYPDIVNYLVLQTSWATGQQMKAYKSLEAYNFFVSGWVNSILTKKVTSSTRILVTGASPDGLVMCDCCGIGLCEIKCPYKHRNTTIAESLNDKGFCLHMIEHGSIQLNTNHQYYHQVQCQLFGTDTAYCDFVVWTEEDLFCQRILPDEEFWNTNLPKAISFFKKGLLPEVLKSICCEPSELAQDSDEDGPWCFCQEDIEESMLVRWDKTNCSIKWFHMDCVGLSIVPNGEWICTYCLELR
ncbi:predicted protein [Nematostella vectensis]|uniref:Zinc finger PHD-type domain-containing protein n=1 Tax=Nematostella vectensis TaxID=45351 RepID=A7TCB9_NEMVE|nr:predicted protein [Nematostella vectensis]|eukprot:XP_001618414.1 hypothetical protein NEMVEDRAFT_v1g225175 [Nematostella vectensis]